MKKATTVIGISMANIASGLLVLVGLIAIDLMRVGIQRANRSTIERTKVTPLDREKFEGRIQELEFRVVNVGQTVIAR